MFCKFCGAQVADNAAFCPSCGKALKEAAPAVMTASASGGGVVLTNSKPNAWNWIFSLAIVPIIQEVIFGILAFLSGLVSESLAFIVEGAGNLFIILIFISNLINLIKQASGANKMTLSGNVLNCSWLKDGFKDIPLNAITRTEYKNNRAYYVRYQLNGKELFAVIVNTDAAVVNAFDTELKKAAGL